MNEDNKIRSVTITSVFLIAVALFFLNVIVSCCTPTKELDERLSTKEYKEVKMISATIVFIDSTIRDDHWVSVLYWKDEHDVTRLVDVFCMA